MCLKIHVFEISLCWNFNEFNCRMIKSTHYLLTTEFLTMHNILFQQKLNFFFKLYFYTSQYLTSNQLSQYDAPKLRLLKVFTLSPPF